MRPSAVLYTVKLHRITLLVLALGLLVVGGLTFFAGLLVGVRWAGPGPGEEAAAAELPVAELAADESAAGPSPAAAPAERFAVQVAVFTTAEDAAARVAELTAHGYEPYVVTLRGDRQRTLLRSVRLGPFSDRRAAEKAALGFTVGEGREASVVRETAPPAPDAP